MKRREGLAKLTGRERYVDDLPVDDCLWGVTVRSPAPRGRIADVTGLSSSSSITETSPVRTVSF
jgi:CO/xanthine dehydrogenase Mo-binding subunit